ncbi:sulfotransferase [Burkholderia pseudomultivorans]|uniref:sulfotransferase family protein n=1 Tax=Burkholderia pseudomultivorans TaxID=1207504 RepID=UPI002874E463|nr:sulfotransferase [Burkholderia pseudomultivorans]MDS0860453.1 sulfotransferase [Burkholderia pseudomultivorans]
MNAPLEQIRMQLDPDALIAEAVSRTGGLTAFGDGPYRDALDVMCASLIDDARLSARGVAMMREKLVGQLVNRLVVESYCGRHPDIADIEIDDPLVIVGLPRTGTTLLQRLLAVDARFHSAAWWETRYPAPLAGETLAEPTVRIARARAEVATMIDCIPQILSIHPLDAMLADEEFMLMEHSFVCAMDSYANVPRYTAWLEQQDLTPVYTYLKRMLQFLQWQKAQRGVAPAARWLLKTPQHLHALDVLCRVFPRAQVVLTHRDPAQTIPSMASMAHTLWQMYADDPDPRTVGAQWRAGMARAIGAAMRARDALPAERFLDIRFEDTVSDPLGVAEAVYRFAGLPLDARQRTAMADWLARNGRDKRAAHDYSIARFGLTDAQLARDFAAYRARHLQAAG